jgi:hypothetical protein
MERELNAVVLAFFYDSVFRSEEGAARSTGHPA